MTFWIIVIGAGVYFLCNQIVGKSEAVKSFIACAAELGRLAFFAGLLAYLLK